MTMQDFSEPNVNSRPKRQIGMLTIFRLGLFNMGLGIMAVLIEAVLNRVMISEFAIPATITAGIIALSKFVAPARVWFGQLSDRKPLFGKYRTSYVLLGTFIFSLTIFLASQIIWQLGSVVRSNGGWTVDTQTVGFSAILALIFTIYGLAVSSSSTPFTALLVDITEEDRRSKLIAIIWSMLLVGIIVGAIIGNLVFKNIDAEGITAGNIPLEMLQPPINFIFTVVPVVVVILAFIATWGVEKRYSRFSSNTVTSREDSITIGRAIATLTTSRQTGIFFTFLSVLTIGLFMQEAVLEPYGGEVFGMSISETTLLNAFWGAGTLIGYAATGFKIIPTFGKKRTTKLGCILVAFCFSLIILAGFTQQPRMLQSAMVLFGLATGIATVGGISLMLDLTAAETAGTFIGAWGLAQAMSRGLATLIGGIILDIGKGIFATPLLAYGLVFGIQALCMIAAIITLSRVDVKEFKETTNKALSTVMEGDLDG